jgi:hypothetical protein
MSTTSVAPPSEPQPEGYSKEQIVEQLKRDIEQFTVFKGKIITLLVTVMANVEKYSNKLKNAKAEFSRELYGKKLKRHQRDMQELLFKGNQVDLSIENFKQSIASFETEEKTDTTDATETPSNSEGETTSC